MWGHAEAPEKRLPQAGCMATSGDSVSAYKTHWLQDNVHQAVARRPIGDWLRSIRATRATPGWRELLLLVRLPVEQGQNAGPPSPCGAVGESLGLVRASPHCCLDTSVRGPLRHAKDSLLPARPEAWGRAIQSPWATAQSAHREAASSSAVASARPTGPWLRPRSLTALQIQDSSEKAKSMSGMRESHEFRECEKAVRL
jgi:hypothetical protein